MNRVEIERDGTVAILRLNRPEVLNAVDQAMWTALLDALAAMYSESASTRRSTHPPGAGKADASQLDAYPSVRAL